MKMSVIQKFLKILSSMIILAIICQPVSGFSQKVKTRIKSPANFDSTVFSNPNVVKSYYDETGRQVVEIRVPGVLPGIYKMPEAQPTDAAVILNNVPAYDWSFGCSATAAAMMAGYYDNNGYPEMYTGPANGGVAPMDNSIWGQATINGEVRSLCPLSATRLGLDGRNIKGHVDDFWINAGNGDPDPYIGHWTAHPYGDCTGDFMKTNQSEKGNIDGSTIYVYYVGGAPFTENNPTSSDGNYGLRLFFESRGAVVFSYYNQYIYGHEGNTQGFTFEQYKQQIDAGHPVILQLAGHSVLGLGYDDASQTAYVHNTWDYGLSELSWGGIYADMQHYGVSVIELLPVNSPILTVTPINQTVSYQQGNTTFSVISNRSWMVSENTSWLNLAQNSGIGNGSFSVVFDQNTSATERSAQITVTAASTGYIKNNLENKSILPLIWEPFSGPDLPAGWQVSDIGSSNWAIADASIAGSVPPLLKFNWEPQIIGLSRMMTNIVNTSGMTSLILSFKQLVNRYEASFVVGVATSGDGGNTWQTVWSQNITENLGPENKTLIINNADVGSSQFRIGFYFEGNTWNIWDWNIDNVLLEEFDNTETITITQQANPSITQNLSINGGWSGVSLYLNPSDASVANMMTPLANNFVILKTLTGVYYPTGGINTLGSWDVNKGYIIKLQNPATLPVTGILPSGKTITLNSGWNLIPVLSTSNVNTATLFSGVLSKLIAVMDVAGTGIYWPQMSINTLPALQPGKSYFVKMNSGGTISFP